jgi:23S rRNA (uracil1939-C5)-methyltransferase
MAIPETPDTITPGQELELAVEKPAAGGRMIARHHGQVLLVLGAIPGERVVARVERAERRLAFAETVRVLDRSADRRDVAFDPRCGGCAYAHVTYQRQLALKADVIADAFTRIGRMPLDAPVPVAASPERGSRLRARLHVRNGRAGFFREGTHDICDAAQTGHLLDETLRGAAAVLDTLTAAGVSVASLEISENIAADQRAVHVEPSPGLRPTETALAKAAACEDITGCTVRVAGGRLLSAGVATVSDPLTVLTSGRAGAGELHRHPESFFQANRYLLPELVGAVMDAVPGDGSVLDLYAGVGLFSVSLAASGRERITAVEGDRTSGSDLQRNAAACGSAVRVVVGSVEDYVTARRSEPARTIIVDPPRTGISKGAMEAVVRHGAERIIYVSCDPATMARDARRLLDGGYALESLRAFDLFPNTAHVETLAVFDRR